MARTKYRVGVIGLGFGRAHIPAFQANGCEVVAVCQRNQETARAVAEHLVARIRESGTAKPYDGAGSCFIEFGDGNVGRVDVDFLTGPSVVAPFSEPSEQGAAEKAEFAASRRRWWFGG